MQYYTDVDLNVLFFSQSLLYDALAFNTWMTSKELCNLYIIHSPKSSFIDNAQVNSFFNGYFHCFFILLTGERLAVWENLGMKPSANQFAELGNYCKIIQFR